MNIMAHHHTARLQAPYYSRRAGDVALGQNPGVELHRYFEPEFINRFQRDLQRHQAADKALLQWRAEDAFSRHDSKPVLRLPMHKSFYLVSCELVCDHPGKPALDPQKIRSAGFVIRRLSAAGEQSWMLDEDEALGWQNTPTGLRDPDVHRRLCCGQGKVKLRGVKPLVPPLSYTGEQIHPLHAVKSLDDQGKTHTILFGYLPLGGSYMHRQFSAQGKLKAKVKGNTKDKTSPFDAQSQAQFATMAAQQIPWPFGFKPVTPGASVNQSWAQHCARPVTHAVPSLAFYELLKILVNRYHLGEQAVADNEQLEDWAARQYFYQESSNNLLSPTTFSDYTRATFANARRTQLGSWLKSLFSRDDNPLIGYMALMDQRLDANLPLQALPWVSNYSLYITQGDAQELRSLLDQRVLNQALGKVKEIPLPKFGQAKEDIYQIIPFVRLGNDCGGEEIIWGDAQTRSEIFRVAAPFDPNASRPSLIQMPSLADLKSGMARGVSMITPPDTFSLLNALNLKKGASEEVLPSGDHPSLGIQWICSFSLPVITLVAMILLMIMISLLNIVFFWLPWVRICLPFPSIKKE